MSDSEKEIKESIKGLKKAYNDFLNVNEKYLGKSPENYFINAVNEKEHVLSATAHNLQFHSSLSQILILQDLSLEMNSLKKQVALLNSSTKEQTETNKKSAKQQRWLTAAIIFIGLVSLLVTILQISKV